VCYKGSKGDEDYCGKARRCWFVKTAVWLFSFSLLAPAGKVITFDTCQIGQEPPGWTVADTGPGSAPGWEILKDRTAPTQPYVFAQVSVDAPETRHPLAILNDPSTRDADVSVRLKPVSGRDGLAGGVVWRYRDENNYYLVRASAMENTVAVFKVENGQRIPILAAVKHAFPANAWSILKVSVRGPRFQVFIDHRRVLEGQDRTFAAAGRVGLWTLADSVIYFDDFRVYPK
jgi:hypothetical protein